MKATSNVSFVKILFFELFFRLKDLKIYCIQIRLTNIIIFKFVDILIPNLKCFHKINSHYKSQSKK